MQKRGDTRIIRILTMRGEKDNCHQYVSAHYVKSSLHEVRFTCQVKFSMSHQWDLSLLDNLNLWKRVTYGHRILHGSEMANRYQVRLDVRRTLTECEQGVVCLGISIFIYVHGESLYAYEIKQFIGFNYVRFYGSSISLKKAIDVHILHAKLYLLLIRHKRLLVFFQGNWSGLRQ